jgi:hypothetical protein
MKTLSELQDILDDDFLDPNMPKELVEEELRALGFDPDDAAQIVKAFVESSHDLRSETFVAGLAEDFRALREDPAAWAEELGERSATGVSFSGDQHSPGGGSAGGPEKPGVGI